MTETAIGYARKSIYVSGLEDERESVLYQLNQIEEYADEHDLELINIYSDIGVSGVLKSRPDLNKMLAFLRNYVQEKDEKVNYLIFYNQERLARDLSTSIELMLEITELVEEIVFVADETNTSIRNFRSTFLVNAAKAAENRRFIKKRLRQGRKAKVVYSNLYRSTFKPLGYVQPKKKELVLASVNQTRDKELNNELMIVQSIFLAYLSGMSLRKIANWLNTEFGLTKRGKQWSYKSVQYILRNPVYAGILSSVFMKNKETKQVETIESLVSISTFEYVKRKLDQESSGNKNKAKKHMPDLSLCFECFRPLELKNGGFRCPSCEREICINLFISLVRDRFVTLLTGNKIQQPILKDLLNEKMHHIESHLYSITKKLKELVQREKEIKSQLYFQNEKSLRLQEANQKEQTKLQQQLFFEKGFYQLLKGTSMDNLQKYMETGISEKGLVVVPYLLLVDFNKKNIYIKFHQNLFNQVNNNEEPFELQMVDEDIFLSKNIRDLESY